MLKKLVISMMLFIMLAIPASATSGYLVSQDSVVANPGDTIDVEVWVDVDEPTGCTGGSIEIMYCATCTDAIAYTPAPSGTWTLNTCNSVVSGREFITIVADPAQTGSLLVGTLTFECMSPGDCQTPLTFDAGCVLNNGTIKPIEDVEWIDGSFKCGVLQQCLGDCYNAAGALIGTDVPCYECLDTMGGQTWENYEFESPCSPGTTVPRRPYDYCPECCDGINNGDGDNLIDWPADPECACCLDETEDVDEGCPPPCVPELPTLALAGIGILGIALLARKRD